VGTPLSTACGVRPPGCRAFSMAGAENLVRGVPAKPLLPMRCPKPLVLLSCPKPLLLFSGPGVLLLLGSAALFCCGGAIDSDSSALPAIW